MRDPCRGPRVPKAGQAVGQPPIRLLGQLACPGVSSGLATRRTATNRLEAPARLMTADLDRVEETRLVIVVNTILPDF